MYLGEQHIDCSLQINWTLPFLLKNMSVHQTEIKVDHNYCKFGSLMIFIEVGQKLNDSQSCQSAACYAHKFNDHSSSDFTVKCEDKVFYVHRWILKERSEYFEALFRNECLESKNNELTINDYESNTVEQLLRYIYNNTISLEKFDSITKIMKIADKYRFTELFDTCDSHLAQLCAFKLEKAFITRRKLKHYL